MKPYPIKVLFFEGPKGLPYGLGRAGSTKCVARGENGYHVQFAPLLRKYLIWYKQNDTTTFFTLGADYVVADEPASEEETLQVASGRKPVG